MFEYGYADYFRRKHVLGGWKRAMPFLDQVVRLDTGSPCNHFFISAIYCVINWGFGPAVLGLLIAINGGASWNDADLSGREVGS